MARKILFVLLIIALVFGIFLPTTRVQAGSTKGYFTLSVANQIKADDIGYPANYQFVFSIYKEGPLFRQFLLRRGQRVDVPLPSGWYSFKLSDREGKVLAKTRVYYVAPNRMVRWQSNLGPPDLKPTIKLKFQ